MTKRAVICKGDPTSHGGRVLEGSATASANGRAIALKGHMTFCPLCKGEFPITEGLGFHTFFGKGTALDGMKTGCGATLIATTTKGFMEVDDGGKSEDGIRTSMRAGAVAEDQSHSGTFQAIDKRTMLPVQGMPYRLEFPDGSVRQGVTDAAGYTERVTSHDPAKVNLYWETTVAPHDQPDPEP